MVSCHHIRRNAYRGENAGQVSYMNSGQTSQGAPVRWGSTGRTRTTANMTVSSDTHHRDAAEPLVTCRAQLQSWGTLRTASWFV